MNNNDETTRGNTAEGGAASSWLSEGTVTVTQPLFSGMSGLNRYHGAKDRLAAAGHDLEGQEEDISLRAARAHLNLMRTRELLALASQFLSQTEERHKNIALMVKEGAADAAELLQATEIQAAVRNTRLGYEESFRQAEADYIEVVGAAPEQTLEFGDTTWNAFIPPTVTEAVTSAVSQNPAVLAADSISSALHRESHAEQAVFWPVVDAEMSYMKKDQLDVVGGESSNAQAMVKLGWNFSVGGGQFARIRKVREQQKEADARRLGVIRNVEHDVRQKYTSMEIVDQQLALLVERENAGKTILDNYISQFEAGKQSNLQLISATARVFEAQASRTDTYYRRLLARFELLNAMGRLRDAFMPVPGKSQKG